MPEEIKFDQKAFDEVIEKQNKGLKALQDSIAGKADAETLTKASKQLEEMQDSLAEIGMVGDVKLSEYLANAQKQNDSFEKELEELKKGKGIGESWEAKLNNLVTDEEFKSAMKSKSSKEFPLDTKAALATSTAHTSDASTTDLTQMNIPGIEKSPWMKTPLYAGVNKRIVGEKVGSIRYTEEISKTNSAAFLAEGGTFAQSEAGWYARTENFYKAGHYVTFPKEMIEDSDYVMGELDDLLRNGMLQVVNKKMWLGAGSASDEILGLINTTAQIAKTFALPWNLDEKVAAPNYWDVFRVAKLQASNGVDTDGTGDQEGYSAGVVFVNPGTLTYMKSIKDLTNGRPIWTDYMTQDGSFDGMTIVEDRRIPAGKFVVGDTKMTSAFIKRNLTIESSDNVASQFLSDQVSIKASMRLAYVTKVLSRYAWVYGDFDTATGLIAAD